MGFDAARAVVSRLRAQGRDRSGRFKSSTLQHGERTSEAAEDSPCEIDQTRDRKHRILMEAAVSPWRRHGAIIIGKLHKDRARSIRKSLQTLPGFRPSNRFAALIQRNYQAVTSIDAEGPFTSHAKIEMRISFRGSRLFRFPYREVVPHPLRRETMAYRFGIIRSVSRFTWGHEEEVRTHPAIRCTTAGNGSRFESQRSAPREFARESSRSRAFVVPLFFVKFPK
jgi:hypothetical protein